LHRSLYRIKIWGEKNIRVRKSHPNSAHLNNLLIIKLTEANKMPTGLHAEKHDLSTNRIKAKLLKSSSY